MIVYGGQDWLVGGAFSDSWVLLEFNGLAEARWVQVNPVNAPPPARYHPVGAYDEQSNRLIVFGGSLTPTCCTELQPLNDVWVLSNANGNQPPVANAGPDQTVIVGETVTLDGSGSHDPDGTIASFSWDFGDNTTGSGDITTHTYSAAGTYPVVLTVTDNAGASSTDTATVTVLTTGQAIQSLTSIVQSFDLRQGITTSLDAKIQNALDAMSAANAGARSDAANKLMAFINSVEAQRGKQLTNAQADTLEALARRILAVI
ncbi:MAG: PKD domain-containing protein [Terriglobales bacterium]